MINILEPDGTLNENGPLRQAENAKPHAKSVAD